MTTGCKALGRRVGGVVAILLALGPAVIATAPAAEAAYVPSAATVAAYEARVIYRINDVRARYGRRRLASVTCPDWYAERWAPYLAQSGYFYHRSMYPILRGCHATVAAENLARGNISADWAFVLWMRSPGHRKNIMDGRLNRIGVAAVYVRGQWTVVANFTRT